MPSALVLENARERGEALHFPRLFVVLFGHEKSTEKFCLFFIKDYQNEVNGKVIVRLIGIGVNNI
jgi:hypothetical protein